MMRYRIVDLLLVVSFVALLTQVSYAEPAPAMFVGKCGENALEVASVYLEATPEKLSSFGDLTPSCLTAIQNFCRTVSYLQGSSIVTGLHVHALNQFECVPLEGQNKWWEKYIGKRIPKDIVTRALFPFSKPIPKPGTQVHRSPEKVQPDFWEKVATNFGEMVRLSFKYLPFYALAAVIVLLGSVGPSGGGSLPVALASIVGILVFYTGRFSSDDLDRFNGITESMGLAKINVKIKMDEERHTIQINDTIFSAIDDGRTYQILVRNNPTNFIQDQKFQINKKIVDWAIQQRPKSENAKEDTCKQITIIDGEINTDC